ncbi:Pseudouridylate synthase [Thermoplasmatales archaeon BRNA1]|nr:Pseudouridylate synthase [Thermoplasmatales archaeon BRNA1]
MRRVAVKIAYLGDGFSGSQIQPRARNLRTVQSEILEKILLVDHVPCDDIEIKFSSRTDAGVSALGNVVCFHTEFKDLGLLLKALNSVSRGIYYRSVVEVPETFNPRIADKRYYRYTCPDYGIDFEKFKEAAKLFEGHHDFKRFAKNETGKTTVMCIDTVDVRHEGNLLTVDFCANYFMWNMIRRIMAAVIQVGKGMTDCEDVKRKLAGEDGTFGLAKPTGLTLLDVTYPDIVFEEPAECPYEKNLRQDLYVDNVRLMFHKSL